MLACNIHPKQDFIFLRRVQEQETDIKSVIIGAHVPHSRAPYTQGKIPPLIINSTKISATNSAGSVLPGNAKYPMHIKGFQIVKTHPSSTDPLITLDKTRNLEALTPGYARGIHALLKHIVERSKFMKIVPKIRRTS